MERQARPGCRQWVAWLFPNQLNVIMDNRGVGNGGRGTVEEWIMGGVHQITILHLVANVGRTGRGEMEGLIMYIKEWIVRRGRCRRGG